MKQTKKIDLNNFFKSVTSTSDTKETKEAKESYVQQSSFSNNNLLGSGIMNSSTSKFYSKEVNKQNSLINNNNKVSSILNATKPSKGK
jgi:hypothetical protein